MLELSREIFVSLINTNPPPARFAHAMMITGLDIYLESSYLIGQAGLATVCSDINRRKYSINDDRDYDALLIMMHELGLALGSNHDENMFGPCICGTMDDVSGHI